MTPKIRQQLRAKAHGLKPVVMIGNKGLSPAVEKEVAQALYDHELIKVRVHSQDKEQRLSLFQQLALSQAAELIQRIGCIGVFYRPRKE